ncbi:MAG: hypothetical protein M3Q55_09380 [Acidobacteriota bacterium]|nr:hypothetical protein [Acidobacteriota bacterium]
MTDDEGDIYTAHEAPFADYAAEAAEAAEAASRERAERARLYARIRARPKRSLLARILDRLLAWC